MNLSHYRPTFSKSSQYNKQSINDQTDHFLNQSSVKFKKQKSKIPKSINNTFQKMEKSNKKSTDYQLNSILKTEFIPTSIKKNSLRNSKRPGLDKTNKKVHNSSISSSKKHTISVFQFDHQAKQNKKKDIQSRKDIESKVKSIHTTKRKTSTKVNRTVSSLTTVNIKQKINHFKILSNCLKQYIKTQKKENNFIDPKEIIKMIKAFNKSQISEISRPLELLISQMICVIQDCFPQSSHLNKDEYETPMRNKQFKQQLSQKQIQSKTKGKYTKMYTEAWQPQREVQRKLISEYNQVYQKKSIFQPLNHEFDSDLSKKQENIQLLKYESNRLKKFVDQQVKKDKNQKQKELQELKKILNQQQQLLQQLQNQNQKYKQLQYQDQSEESQLKYCQN